MDVTSTLDRYLRVKTTQVEMVRDRGYEIPEDEKIFLTGDLDIHRFKDFIGDGDEVSLNRVYQRPDDGERLMVVYLPYSLNDKGELKAPGKQELAVVISRAVTDRVQRLVVVVPVTPRGGVSAMFSPEEYPALDLIQIFTHNELGFNVTKNSLVPRHQLLSRDQLEKILGGDLSLIPQLPGINVDDPQTRYHGGRLGDVFLIHRVEFVEVAVQRYFALRRVTDTKQVFTAIDK